MFEKNCNWNSAQNGTWMSVRHMHGRMLSCVRVNVLKETEVGWEMHLMMNQILSNVVVKICRDVWEH